jgi:hypothetical protein
MKKLILLAAMVSSAAGAQQSVTVAGQKNASPWLKAESQHFIVFSNTSNDDVRQLLDNLEKLDHVLRLYTNGYRTAPSQSRKSRCTITTTSAASTPPSPMRRRKRLACITVAAMACRDMRLI